MIYTVTYFNPLGNCDNVTHVEADNEVDAALIAHADFWVTSKPFDLSDYNVVEYSPEYVVRREDILESRRGYLTVGCSQLAYAVLYQRIAEALSNDWI